MRAVGCGPLKDTLIDFIGSEGKVRPVTVLGGANGSGKTTDVELIAALSDKLDLSSTREWGILERTKFAQDDFLLDGVIYSVLYGKRPADVSTPGQVIDVTNF